MCWCWALSWVSDPKSTVGFCWIVTLISNTKTPVGVIAVEDRSYILPVGPFIQVKIELLIN
jgi:hypothetical protein